LLHSKDSRCPPIPIYTANLIGYGNIPFEQNFFDNLDEAFDNHFLKKSIIIEEGKKFITFTAETQRSQRADRF